MRDLDPLIKAELQKNGVAVTHLLTLTQGVNSARFTTWNESLIHDGNTYLPRAFRYRPFEAGQDVRTINAEMEVDNIDLALTALAFGSGSKPNALKMEMKLAFLDMTAGFSVISDPTGPIPIFYGRASIGELNRETANFYIVSEARRVKEVLPRRTFSDMCSWRFTDPTTCKATAFEHLGFTIDSATLQTITDAALVGEPDDRYKDGYITLLDAPFSGLRVRLSGFDGTNGVLTLENPLSQAPAGTYDLRSGCSRSFQVCETRYNNADRFGAFPNRPRRIK